MVNSHGDRFRPLRIVLWDPFQVAFLWIVNGSDLTISGMIVQASPDKLGGVLSDHAPKGDERFSK